MSGVRIGPFDLDAAAHVARHMRDFDRVELAAMGAPDDPAEAAWRFSGGPVSFIAYRGDAPIALVSGVEGAPGAFAAGLIATDRWPEVGGAVRRHLKAVVFPALAARPAGLRRVEARALAAHTQSVAWMKSVGFVHECDLIAYGLGGQDCVQMAMRQGEIDHVLWR